MYDNADVKRVILLGASNVSRGISTIIERCMRVLSSPLHVYAAHGHGRSYGTPSRVLGRSLPGIIESDLWNLEHSGQHETYGLVTDIGNDIVYGHDPDLIASWVDQCLSCLRGLNARVVLTSLPITSVRSMSRAKFHLVRRLFFPRCTLRMDEILDRVSIVNELVRQLARQYNTAIVDPPPQWYGHDPIHIKRTQQARAWTNIISQWNRNGDDLPAYRPSLRRWATVRITRPLRMKVFGVNVGRSQPSCYLDDGSTISFY